MRQVLSVFSTTAGRVHPSILPFFHPSAIIHFLNERNPMTLVKALIIDYLQSGPEIAPGNQWALASGAEGKISLALRSGNFGPERFFVDAWKLLDARI